MKSFPVSSALVLVMSVLLAAPSAAQVTSPVVGAIDVGAIVDQYPVFIKMRAALDKRYGEFQMQIQASAEKLEQMRMTLGSMGEDAPQRTDFEFQYKMALQTQDFQRKNYNDQLANEELRVMLEIYEDLDYAVAKVAKKRGVALVVPKRDIPPSPTPVADMKIREVQDRVGAFQRRTVWYASKTVDMTSAVIKYMQDPLPARTSPERAPKSRPAGTGTPGPGAASNGARNGG